MPYDLLPYVSAAYLLFGFSLLALVAVDVFWTAIAPRGAGPITARAGRRLWQGALWLYRRRGGPQWLLEGLGPIMVLGVVAVWGLLLWIGWTLIFSSAFDSISSTHGPLDLFGRLYFVGYDILTLGIGDYTPKPGWWQIATVVASASGLTVATLGVTYILSALDSATEGRGLAAYLYGLGASPSEVLTRAWTNDGWGELPSHVVGATPLVAEWSERHLAYPALHYFHSRNPRQSIVLRMVVFSEALNLLSCAVAEEARPDPSVLEPALSTVDGYLHMVRGMYHLFAEETEPPDYDLEPLRRAGIPLAPEKQCREAFEAVRERRIQLARMLESDAWDPAEVLSGETPRAAEAGWAEEDRSPGAGTRGSTWRG